MCSVITCAPVRLLRLQVLKPHVEFVLQIHKLCLKGKRNRRMRKELGSPFDRKFSVTLWLWINNFTCVRTISFFAPKRSLYPSCQTWLTVLRIKKTIGGDALLFCFKSYISIFTIKMRPGNTQVYPKYIVIFLTAMGPFWWSWFRKLQYPKCCLIPWEERTKQCQGSVQSLQARTGRII